MKYSIQSISHKNIVPRFPRRVAMMCQNIFLKSTARTFHTSIAPITLLNIPRRFANPFQRSIVLVIQSNTPKRYYDVQIGSIKSSNNPQATCIIAINLLLFTGNHPNFLFRFFSNTADQQGYNGVNLDYTQVPCTSGGGN